MWPERMCGMAQLYCQMSNDIPCFCVAVNTRNSAMQVCGIILKYAFEFTHKRSKTANGALLYRFDVKVKDINVRHPKDFKSMQKLLLQICH